MTKPGWLKTRPPSGEKFLTMKSSLEELGLNTVCTGARCPNVGECWSRGTATFMIMGSVCTRTCSFCAVKKGLEGEPLDTSEPARIARAVKRMGLGYAVLTSVDRDDLADGGAEHFADCIKAIKNMKVIVEALIPDFQGSEDCLRKIIEAGPDVVGHNIETVKEFQALARDRRAGYHLSLEVLSKVKQIAPYINTKSSLMLGIGEAEEMVLRTMDDLRTAGVDFLTLGQYLRPSEKQMEVKEYVPPVKFAFYKKIAESKGFISVSSGPLVRSSYMAEAFSKD
ncbi:MAG: lipoyl synthase [Candidatus Methanoperedens sp.]|nr:lipoyl synthase [Candidatus Methanoperedens sp.]MCZ7370162.1 lipoyl synthase [Candidatus Methanoperedens sp.]